MRSRLTGPAKRAARLLVLALVVHVFVIPQIGGARKALSVMGSVDPRLLVSALVLEALSLAAYARLTQLLLPEPHRPSFGIVLGTVVASTGVNHVVPGGAATTAAVNYRLLGRSGVPSDELGFALGMQAIGSAVVLNLLLWCALIASIPVSGFHPVYGTVAGVGAVLIGLFSAAVVALLRGRDRFADRVAHLVAHLPRVDEGAFRRVLVGLADQVRALAEDGRRLRRVVGYAAANWLLDAAALWVVIAAFGPTAGVVGVLVAYGLANVMAAIPVSPGGLGVVEAILIPTLVGFGTPRAEAAVAVVAYRIIEFWLPIPAGALGYLAVARAVAPDDRSGFWDEIDRRWRRLRARPTPDVGPPT